MTKKGTFWTLLLGFYFSVWKREMHLIASDWSGSSLFVSFCSLFFYILCLQVGHIFKTYCSHIFKKLYTISFLVMREVNLLLRNFQLLSQLSQRTCLSSVSLISNAPYKEIFLRSFLFQNKGYLGSSLLKVYFPFTEEKYTVLLVLHLWYF